MLFGDLIKSVSDVNQKRFRGGGDSHTARFKDMVEGWICGGANVAAIFSKDTFISAHDSHNVAIAKARALRNSGIPDLRIRNVIIK